ncbi:hypothetical protein F5Y17DRAFT_416224 [Xylariaceae sp. FL0594]|nr:hypothetical protein F5Y17DRAFT_416224 [Xylariaceae sp. FL0594]
MEGVLLVPPDRGTILGRAVWKPRYVVIGTPAPKDGPQSNLSLSQVLSTSRIREAGTWSSKSQQKAPADLGYISVYKSKEDSEPIQQYPIASISDCQVQHTAHRKGGQVLPTLVIHISPDLASDKLRKRRSSRTSGLMAAKDPGPTTLWFVTAEESRHGLGDWARCIQALMRQHQQSMPATPVSPISPIFTSPFSPLQDAVEKPEKHEKAHSVFSAKGKLRSKLQSKSNRPPPPARENSAMYPSRPPSLRSRRSDISSQASSMIPAAMSFVQQHYSNMQHSEMPSPTSTVDEYPEQFIEGWTNAQGRTSALSSPTRGRTSISSSSLGPTNQSSLDSSPPTAPRETILDRAFQMRFIPGSDRPIAGDENLTSLAKFEALMNERESRREAAQKESQEPPKSTWEEDDESEEDEFDKEVDEDEDSDEYYASDHNSERDDMDYSTRKALQFIANRHGSIHSESGLSSAPSILRPHTAHSRSRPMTERTISQPHIPNPPLQIPSSPPFRQAEEYSVRRTHEKRHSTSDVKNMGFNDFAKRLSGTGSLLLVQSNVSGGSNRGSGDFTPRGSMSSRGLSRTPSERDESCRWRGSIGIFGNEGGLL